MATRSASAGAARASGGAPSARISFQNSAPAGDEDRPAQTSAPRRLRREQQRQRGVTIVMREQRLEAEHRPVAQLPHAPRRRRASAPRTRHADGARVVAAHLVAGGERTRLATPMHAGDDGRDRDRRRPLARRERRELGADRRVALLARRSDARGRRLGSDSRRPEVGAVPASCRRRPVAARAAACAYCAAPTGASSAARSSRAAASGSAASVIARTTTTRARAARRPPRRRCRRRGRRSRTTALAPCAAA